MSLLGEVRDRAVSCSSTANSTAILESLGKPSVSRRNIPGITWKTDYEGTFRFGRRTASVLLESSRHLTIAWSGHRCCEAPTALLTAMEMLGGNTRYVRRGNKVGLLADVAVGDGNNVATALSALRESFELGAGILAGTRVAPVQQSPEPPLLEQSAVEQALAGFHKDDPALVRRQSEWELRLPLAARVFPVRLRRVERALAVSCRTFRNDCRSAVQEVALTDHILRFNARLRGCRLRSEGTAFIAETRLDRHQLDRAHLLNAARAVAIAARVARTEIQLLALRPVVAATYRAVMGV